MTFSFNSFEPAAKLNYIIEGVRPLGLPATWAGVSDGYQSWVFYQGF